MTRSAFERQPNIIQSRLQSVQMSNSLHTLVRIIFAAQIESGNYKFVLLIEPQFDFHLPR